MMKPIKKFVPGQYVRYSTYCSDLEQVITQGGLIVARMRANTHNEFYNLLILTTKGLHSEYEELILNGCPWILGGQELTDD